MGKTITRRWIVNGLGLIFIILIIIEIVAAFIIRSYYYDGVEQKIITQMDVITRQILKYSNDSNTDFSDELRTLVEEFGEKDTMELMAIGQGGKVLITSSGFLPSSDVTFADYETAITSQLNMGKYVGSSYTGERISALTRMVSIPGDQITAIRFVVAMDKIDSQITFIILVLILAGLGVLLFVILSGSYFINSIVIPIGQISQIARKIAQGDFEASLVKRYNDEIGDLCDTINYMAAELKETENIKNDFISSVSHELRTPLTAIKGWGETIIEVNASKDDLTDKGMKIILSETDRLSSMVEELLDFSRIQCGNLKLFKQTYNIISDLEQVAVMFSQRALQEKKEFELIHNMPDGEIVFLGDKNRMRQVFVNVIDNALKYTNENGKITIEYKIKPSKEHELKKESLSNAFIEIYINDTGCGIGKVKLKFYKANNTVRGSGIGLAVADEIVKSHEGSLELESIENFGTTVTIKLPIIFNKTENL
ncbi:MAG: HAMP domain-containing sensor histidine kinase [Clostridia bacterium]